MNKISASDGGNTGAQVVVFYLGEQEFCSDICYVKEIVRLEDIIPVPRSPDFVAGVCNLRGNVLPIIDTRKRLGMSSIAATESTRLLVVELNNTRLGLVVDGIREVMRLNDTMFDVDSHINFELDKRFLNGVVKSDGGKRLILNLNLSEMIESECCLGESKGSSSYLVSSSGREANPVQIDDKGLRNVGDERQFVTFSLSGEEYAFDIGCVREILRVSPLTELPNVPSFVRGLLSVREELLPIIDLRFLLGLTDMLSERLSPINNIIDFLDSCRQKDKQGDIFDKFEYGEYIVKTDKFLQGIGSSSEHIQTAVKKARRLCSSLLVVLKQKADVRREDFIDVYEDMIEAMNNLKDVLREYSCEDQRILVVETDNNVFGYLVDGVNEVLHVSSGLIAPAPSLADTQDGQLKGIAKLNGGERLIMIMNQEMLLSGQDKKSIENAIDSDSHISEKEKESKRESSGMGEEQLVTFFVDNQEYGIKIMDVQEINRLDSVTFVPRSPYFVDGVTNLRGNVIPVINMRKLFGLADKKKDDRTRIIIVDIENRHTGLKVDQVSEVLTVSKSDVEITPSIVINSEVNAFMEGVCKINNGNRMLILLNIKKILNKQELEMLASLKYECHENGNKVVQSCDESKGGQICCEAQGDISSNGVKRKGGKNKKKLDIAE